MILRLSIQVRLLPRHSRYKWSKMMVDCRVDLDQTRRIRHQFYYHRGFTGIEDPFPRMQKFILDSTNKKGRPSLRLMGRRPYLKTHKCRLSAS